MCVAHSMCVCVCGACGAVWCGVVRAVRCGACGACGAVWCGVVRVSHQPPQLVTLNLSDNRITRVENLSGLPNLQTLNLAKNLLETADALQHLEECPSLTNLDISSNRLESPACVEVITRLSRLTCLYLHGNKVVQRVPHYRKTLVHRMPGLNYLDDRPVFELDRLTAEAFATGGRQAEVEVRHAYQERQRQQQRDQLERFRNWRTELRQQREQDLQVQRAHQARQEQEQEGAAVHLAARCAAAALRCCGAAVLWARIDAVPPVQPARVCPLRAGQRRGGGGA